MYILLMFILNYEKAMCSRKKKRGKEINHNVNISYFAR